MKNILTSVVGFMLVVNTTCAPQQSAVDIHVEIAPRFSEIYKTLGQDLVAVCRAFVEPNDKQITISWIDPAGRNMSAVSSSRINIKRRHDYSKNSVLHLKELVSSDAGKYTCRVQISNGTSLRTVDVDIPLKIYELQNNVISRQDVSVVWNSPAVLPCSGLGQNEYPIALEHDGTDIYNEILLTDGPTTYGFRDGGLYLHSVIESDAGIYTCRVRNKTTGIITDQIFNLTVTEPALRIVVSNPEVTAREHSRVLLGCLVKSTQRVTVEWKRDGRILYNTDRYRLTEDGIVIDDVRESDAGRYSCKATLDSDGFVSQQFIGLTVKTTTLHELFELQEQTLQALNTVIDIQKQQLLLQHQQLRLQQQEQQQQRPSRKNF